MLLLPHVYKNAVSGGEVFRRRRGEDADDADDEAAAPRGAKKGPNAWQTHVRGFAKQHKLTYWQAIKDPQYSASYRK